MRRQIQKTRGALTLTVFSPVKPASEKTDGYLSTLGWPGALCAVVVGIVFVASGVLKLKSLPAFLIAIEGFQLAPTWMAPWLAVTVPWLELLSGACLTTRLWRESAGTVILGMLLAFTAAAIYAMARGLDIECGCFGIEASSKVGATLVVRNTALIALTLIAMGRRSRG